MSNLLPPDLMAKVYDSADEAMMLRVLDGPDGPGLVLLGTLRQLSVASITALTTQLAAEAKSRTTADTSLAGRIAALEAAQLRTEIVKGVAVAGGVTAVTFAKPFKTPPAMIDIPTWSGEQAVLATATEITAAGAKIVVRRSKGTLVLNAGPFEAAPAGTAFVMVALGA